MTHQILRLSGSLDSVSASELRREVTDLVTGDVKVIILDFEGVTFINSSAIGSLIAILKTVIANQGKLFIISINDQVKLIFEITKMDQLFEIYENYEKLESVLFVIS